MQIPAEITIHGERELKEIQAAAKERVAALEKAAKKAEDSYCAEEAAITRKRLRLWQGSDGEPGILERISDQMHAFDPAFSDDGREPDGQQSLFQGADREEEPEAMIAAVTPGALKAALILSGIHGSVGAEAFVRMDDIEEDDPRLRAYLGRAPVELLGDLPPLDALALYQLAEVGQDSMSEAEAALADRIATAIAQHGATLAPYHEPFPMSEEGDRGSVGNLANEEGWTTLSAADLRTIIIRANRRMAADAQAESGQASNDSAIAQRQERILTHSPASSDEFKFAVKTAGLIACERALEIVSGLEGNAGREKAIRRRIEELGGSTEEPALAGAAGSEATADLLPS